MIYLDLVTYNVISQVHLMSERSHIMGKLELACRGCDFILPHTGANKVQMLLTRPPKPV